jgi:DNA primase
MEISNIKQRLEIETVLQYYGMQSDKNNMLKCPFHADDRAKHEDLPKHKYI